MPKVFQAEGAPKEVLDLLVVLRQRDLVIEGKKRLWGRLSCSTVLLGVAAVIFFIMAEKSHWNVQPAIRLVLPIVGVAFLASLITYFVYGARDYDNRKLFMGIDVLNFLRRDMPQKSRCKLDISFDTYQKHGRLVSADKAGIWGSVSEYVYEDAWFNFEGKLYDGNAFDLSISLSVRRRERRKRKYTKVKEKFREEIELRLKVDPETYGGIAKVTDSVTQGASAAGLTIRKVAYEQGKLKIRGRGGVVVQVQQENKSQGMTKANTVFQFLFFVYKALGECRTPAA